MSAYRTLAEILANNESQSEIVPGLIQKYLQSNEYLAWANTVATDRATITVPYVADLGAVQKGLTCASEYTSVAISGGNDIFTLIKYGTQIESCLDVQGLGSSFVDQLSEDLLGGMKRMTNELAIDAITGDGNGEIVGLNTLCTDSVAASGVGGAGHIESLWYLYDQVKAKSAKMALIMNAKTKRAVLSELLASAQVGTVELKGTSFVVPTFNGTPILVNDACTNGDITLVNGDPAEGVFLAVGDYPTQKQGLFNFYPVGMSQTKDTQLFRLNGHFSHIRKSRQALAKVTSWI